MSSILAPSDLRCELLRNPGNVPIPVSRPALSWVVNDTAPNTMQAAYQVQVRASEAPVWDSGKVVSVDSVAVRCGCDLPPATGCQWRVKTWSNRGEESPWSQWQGFVTAPAFAAYQAIEEAVVQEETAPVRLVCRPDGTSFADFGKAIYGTVILRFAEPVPTGEIAVALGECLAGEDTVERHPKGTIRFREMSVCLSPGQFEYRVEIPSVERNTSCPPAVPVPSGIGEILPFRYAEVTGLGRPLQVGEIVRLDTFYPFSEDASAFTSSSPELDQVYDLCRYSIKATNPLGIYIDGDRERIAYEADAFINQLCHYGVDAEYAAARASHEYLIPQPTWPTEWILPSVLIAWADYEYTGDDRSLRARYADLKAKLLLPLAREDGLISTETGLLTQEVLDSVYIDRPLKDIVDWPPGSFTQGGTGERDNHDMRPINTVVNAFHYQALKLMAMIADTVGQAADSAQFAARAELVGETIKRVLFDSDRGIYLDGEGSDHSSLHANMIPLAFGLVPAAHLAVVVSFVKSRGMACSVYGSHYLLESLFAAGEPAAAFSLLTADHDRGWLNMLRAGSTVTLEAWDWTYKNNLDWNHAWGAAPAGVIPRWLVGVRPLTPGFDRILIAPQPDPLRHFSARVPTLRGPVTVQYRRASSGYDLRLTIPANAQAHVRPPNLTPACRLALDAAPVPPADFGNLILGSGTHTLRVDFP